VHRDRDGNRLRDRDGDSRAKRASQESAKGTKKRGEKRGTPFLGGGDDIARKQHTKRWLSKNNNKYNHTMGRGVECRGDGGAFWGWQVGEKGGISSRLVTSNRKKLNLCLGWVAFNDNKAAITAGLSIYANAKSTGNGIAIANSQQLMPT